MNPYETGPLRLLTYLTRRQAWLSPPEVASKLHIGAKRPSERTIHRWFSSLRREAGLAYYPVPRSSMMGLQNTSVKIHGLRTLDLLSIVPFGAGLTVEIDLADGHPVLTQDFRVPPFALGAFRDFWLHAQDAGLIEGADIIEWRSTHEFYTPFQDAIQPTGHVSVDGKADNRYFAALAAHNLAQERAPKVSGRFAKYPLVISNVVEHLFGSYSSSQIWAAMEANRRPPILRRRGTSSLSSRKARLAAVRMIQEQWREMMQDFDDPFVQPVVGIRLNRDVAIHSFEITSKEPIMAGLRASRWSLRTSLRTQWGTGDRTRITCIHPTDRFTDLLRTMRESNARDAVVRVFSYDGPASDQLAARVPSRTDWSLFDPESLAWEFDEEAYQARLADLRGKDTAWAAEYFRVPSSSSESSSPN